MLIAVLAASTVRGQVGTLEFLAIGAGSRALAMGGAYVALADDGTAALWNPAGLAGVHRYQGYLSHVSMFNNLAAHNFAAATLPLGENFTAAVSWVRLSVDDIPRYGELEGTFFDRQANRNLRSTGEPDGYFGSTDDALLLSFSKAFDLEFLVGGGLSPSVVPFRFSVGGNMKLIRRELDRSVATAQGLDLGAIFELQDVGDGGGVQRSIGVGLSVFDLATSKVNWSTGTGESQPTRLLFGMAARQRIPGMESVVHMTLDVETLGAQSMRFGVEYVVRGVLALRTGMRSESWSAGAGLYMGRLLLDYAFSTHTLGVSHRIGGGVSF